MLRLSRSLCPFSRRAAGALRSQTSHHHRSNSTLAFANSLPEDVMWLPMPCLSPSMETGTIVEWTLKEGDEIQQYHVLLKLKTGEHHWGYPSYARGASLASDRC